jgi:hypothetical protein
MSHFTIDRFEGADWAVLENDQAQVFNVPREWLPAGAREGDVVQATEHATGEATRSLRFEIDPVERGARLANVRRLRDRLPRAPKGDISL